MPTPFQSQTLQQLRRSVGFMTGAMSTTRPTAAGATTAHTDISLMGSTNVDQYRGYWVSGQMDATFNTRVASNSSAGVFGYLNAVGTALTTATEVELWEEDFPPLRVNDYIQRAVREASGRSPVYATEFLHTGRNLYSYSLSTNIMGLTKVEYRQSYQAISLDQGGAWTTMATNVVSSADSVDYRAGSDASKLTIAAGFTTGLLAGQTLTATVDISAMSHVEGWIKTNVAMTTANFYISLFDSSAMTTSLQNFVPTAAISSAAWTFQRYSLTSQSGLTAVAAIGATLRDNLAAQVLWTDGFEATQEQTEEWVEVPRRFWWTDQDRRELVFNQEGKNMVSYSLLKLSTVQYPSAPTSNDSVVLVSPEFVIYRAAAIALRARGDRRADRRKADYQQADLYDGLAERHKTAMQPLQNVRWLST